MAELAGFDVIGEIHIETIVDLLDLEPVVNPVDGKPIYVFGGPFSTDLRVDLGAPIDAVTIRLLIDTAMEPQIQQPSAKFVMSFQGGASLTSSQALPAIGGELTALVSVGFALPPGAAASAAQFPVIQFAAPDVSLDAQTRSAADVELGPGGADRLTAGLRAAFAALLAEIGTRSLPVMPFTVVPGVDSHDPRQLSAPPAVAWIDTTTLGVFGYFRAAASGGQISAKRSSDLGQPHPEYFYNQPGLFSVAVGRRIAFLFSPAAFGMVIACPVVRNQVVRSLVAKRELGRWVDWVQHSLRGDEITQEMNARLVQHYIDEMQKDPGKDSQTYFDRAKADIERDIENAIKSEAASKENTWLDSAVKAGPEQTSGIQSVDDAVPPPCGTGTVEIERISVKHAQSDLVPMLRLLEIELAAGKINVRFHVDGLLEMITGDVSLSVDGELEIEIDVDDLGRVAADVKSLTPNINVSASGLTGIILEQLKLIFQGPWHALMVILSIVLQDEMTKAIEERGFPQVLELNTPQQPFPSRIVEIAVAPDSLLLAGLVGRVQHWNEFNPALLVEATLDSRTPADADSITGELELKSTDWGCLAAEFTTTRTFWDETYSVHARLRDAPIPATVLDWQIELGNFSWDNIAGIHILDPRPTWSGEPQTLADGVLTLNGEVEHLDPLIRPELRGPLASASVPVTVSGDADSGWQFSLRGVDGNFYVRFSLDVRDGGGKLWHGETFIVHHGDQLELPPEYYIYKRDCDARFGNWIRSRFSSLKHEVAVGRVLPGQPVMNSEIREAVAIRTLISAGDPAALEHLIAARERYGAGFDKHLIKVAPLRV